MALKKNRSVSRRSFLSAASGAAAVAPTIIPASALGADGNTAPSDRITIGCIGVGGQGTSNMNAFLRTEGAQVVAVCDVDKARWIQARDIVNEVYGNTDCQTYRDFREVIARDDIDAVSIGTPDHWHCIPVQAAAAAKKHVYCEKPLSLTVQEGQHMREAVHANGITLQTGTWRRSRAGCRRACELVRNGAIGELKTIRIGLPKGYGVRGGYSGAQPPMPIPVGFNYDMWLGETPLVPYTEGRCHFNFRWIMAYSEGYISDWGAHYYDIGQWGNGTDRTGPIRIEGWAKFPPKEDLYDAPIDHELIFTYANGVQMISVTTEDSAQYGITFEGSEGSLWVESDTVKGTPESVANMELGPDAVKLYTSDNHHLNFIECIKSGEETAAPVDVAHCSANICHIGSIMAVLGRTLEWDPEAENFKDDAEANAMLARPMRKPWSLT